MKLDPDGNPLKDKGGRLQFEKTDVQAVVDVGFHSLRLRELVPGVRSCLSVVESIVGHSNPAMTRHYTHTSEEAAGAAVAGLPSVLTDGTTPADPEREPVPDWVMDELKNMTPENCEEVRERVITAVVA